MSSELIKKEKENVVNCILVFMNEEIEKQGALIAQIPFSFEEESEDV
jgi:hypothetical protein